MNTTNIVAIQTNTASNAVARFALYFTVSFSLAFSATYVFMAF